MKKEYEATTEKDYGVDDKDSKGGVVNPAILTISK